MAKLHQFVRSVSVGDLRHHLEQNGISLPANLNWEAPEEEFCKGFLKAVDDLADQERTQLLADIDRISDMTDEVGQAALMALAEWRDRLAAIEGAHRRAHWLYIQSREAFRQAEEIRFADENQNAQRLWDGFVGPRLVDLRLDPEDVERFKATLMNILDAGRVHIEIFGRVRSRSGEPDRNLKQITVYSEDVPVDEVVFATVGVTNQARKPVRETAITYEPASGTIEVVGRVKALREKVAASFVKELLGMQLSGERLPPRRIDLTPLLEPHDLAVDPKDGIDRSFAPMLVATALQTRNPCFELQLAPDERSGSRQTG